ncbi:ankyrin repeat domain-containing protein [Bradyrhizobium oligotrophicum S58]|uniref:Ankyrin repeat domain-containing protein n=1 Tax=Bradyrhizobium oligotrophicum S58 TaxID=1245469 RepID=M4Z5P1_9BRAD|nr:hypothetical protein [Bradyrhizobium oligotrophicum]BAM88589.1 ankyrin repeat domain-containing protein [Bradyrhizobium oligotrophicum S58]
MKGWISLFAIVGFVNSAEASTLTSTELFKLRSAIIEMCRGGTIEGRSSKIAVEATAKGTIVVIKGLLEGGGDAKAELKKEQWSGIAALANPEGYSQCVQKSLDILVPSLSRD